MEQSILKGTSVVDWKVDNAPTNCTPKWVYIGRELVGQLRFKKEEL